jgi:folylpolyglutamate synthase/dihydropteroate synthase
VTQDVDSAVKKALDVSGRDDVILITGSLFVVGEARKIIKG